MKQEIICYTDGSFNVQLKIGGWAAIIFIENKKKVLTRIVEDTNHNRLELIAVIESISYINQHIKQNNLIRIYTDSQYVYNLPDRKKKLIKNDFISSKGTPIQNAELVKKLIDLQDKQHIEFFKVKAHQKKGTEINYNREVDKLSRKIVRDYIKKYHLTT